ncbi:MAG: ATP-binding protein [Sulfuricurvum sp.]
MLKRFTVENFSSYKDENRLELTAGRTEMHPNHLVEFSKVKILKSAILYGANASGKSNLIKAMEYAKEIILKNLDNVETYKKYFRLDSEKFSKPTQFKFEVELDKRFFAYGFSVLLQQKEIEEEWLFEIGNTSPEMIFERKKNSITLGKILKEKKIKNRFDIYSEDMKNQSHQLFLSEIASKELEIEEIAIFNQLYDWFNKKLIVIYPNTTFGGISSISRDNKLSKIFKKYLHEFDTGIIDISSIDEDFEKSFKDLPSKVKQEIEKDLKKNIENSKKIKMTLQINGILYTIYKDGTGELKVQKLGLIHSKEIEDLFELKDESDGTQRLFDLIPLISKFREDYTIVIDEFDRSLHPKLARKFFELFYSVVNSKSQLIVTTHESNLLDLNLVRRDEIWFAEKDNNGASKLFTMNQFSVRYDSKIEKAYLLGRYGAVPIFKTFDEIEIEN